MITDTYARAHESFRAVAQDASVLPADVRVLVALHEVGGEARTDELEDRLLSNPTAIRRSSITLRREGLILADAGPGTTRTRRGTRARLSLTAAGADIARQAVALASTTDTTFKVPTTEGATR